MDRLLLERAQAMLRTSFGLLFSADLASVSLLGSMVLAHGGEDDGFTYYLDAGITETHLIDGGGPPEVARRLGEQLGDALRTSAPVRRIAHGDGGVTVEADGVTVRARYVVVAAPPVLAGRIDYDPPLPDAYAQLMRQMPAGAITRFITVYDTPFWRADGWSGQSAALGSPSPSPSTSARPRPPRGPRRRRVSSAATPSAPRRRR